MPDNAAFFAAACVKGKGKIYTDINYSTREILIKEKKCTAKGREIKKK